MSIPLNIDWQQILLHLFNFAILSAGLYWLLYKPVKAFMAKRMAHYLELDTQTNSKLDQAKMLEGDYQKRLQSVGTEITQKRAKASEDAEKAAAVHLQEAMLQAEKVVESAQKAAVLERAKIIADAQQEITQLAVAATEKLLEQSKVSAFDQFLKVTGGQTHDGT